MVKHLLKPFASLKLTVVLLALAMVLIYAGTWAQMDTGIWRVQKEYFHSIACWVNFETLLPRFEPATSLTFHAWARGSGIPTGFVTMGGYLLGLLLLLNLVAAHIVRFQFTARRIGIFLIHLGLILLLIGEGISSNMQEESRIRIEENEWADYAESSRAAELAIVEAGKDQDTQYVAAAQPKRTFIERVADYFRKDDPARFNGLSSGVVVSDGRFPVEVKVDDFFPNAGFLPARLRPASPTIPDSDGPKVLGARRMASGTESTVDAPGANVTISKDGQVLGRFLLHVQVRPQEFLLEPLPDGTWKMHSPVPPPQQRPPGKLYSIALRFEREYKPYRMYLDKFSFDRYTGTNMARNYSSDIRLVDSQNKETRQVHIWMNHPLRYRGETFYQADFNHETERGTVLQVVSNPGWLMPYIAIGIAGFGLVDHFLITLSGFLLRRRLAHREIFLGHAVALGLCGIGYAGYLVLGLWGIIAAVLAGFALIGAMVWYHVATIDLGPRRARAEDARPRQPDRIVHMSPKHATASLLVPAIALLMCFGVISWMARPARITEQPKYDLDRFARQPISFEGRVQPIDTLARNTLKVLRGRESAMYVDPKTDRTAYMPAAVWLLDLMSDRPANAKSGRPPVHEYKVFRIDHPDIKDMLGLPEKEKYFSELDLAPARPRLLAQFAEARAAREQDPKKLSNYQEALLELERRMELYERLAGLDQIYIVPPRPAGYLFQEVAGAGGLAGRAETQRAAAVIDEARDALHWTALGMARVGPDQAPGLGELGFEAMRFLGSTADSPLKQLEHAPGRWLAQAILFPQIARDDLVFRVSNPDLARALGLPPGQGFYSLKELTRNREKLASMMQEAGAVAPQQQTPLQQATMELAQKLQVYQQIEGREIQLPPGAVEFLAMLNAYRQEEPAEFNRQLGLYGRVLESEPTAIAKARFETWFNHFDPFQISMVFYVVVLLGAAGSWLVWQRPLSRAAFWVLCVALAVHTFGLGARIYISGRPPVTNLASSAIFIGWGAALFAAVIELIFRNSLGSLAAAVIAIPTLLIADRLSLDGDTMAVLQAVLDTNVWLTLHVLTITLGYSATFLAGLLGLAYIILRIVDAFSPVLDKPWRASTDEEIQLHDKRATVGQILGRVIWGITCFAIVFSFIGTILGGIWADQSWGRFWGWDPKENGAVLIVLANAIVLHAWWAGWARERGLALLAIFGNIVTGWSWFGTNMLSVGLHSYGFMAAGVWFLIGFVFLNLIFIGVGLLPLKRWVGPASKSPPPLMKREPAGV